MRGLGLYVVGAALLLLACTPVAAQVSATEDRGHTKAIAPDTSSKPEGTFVVVDGTKGPIAIGALSRAYADIPLKVPPEFSDQGDALVHTATGIRLPKTYRGCRLVVLLPTRDHDGAPLSFAAGAGAEYDCRPSESLTYVLVFFQGNASILKTNSLANTLLQVANSAVQADAHVPNDPCMTMQVPPESPLAGFSVAQCGARWGSHADPKHRLYGTAAGAVGRGSTFIVFSNTCIEKQCDANRLEFGKFINSFDLSTMHDIASGEQ